MSEIPDLCKKLETLALTCLLKPGTPAKLICRHFKAIRSICLIPEWDTKVYNEHLELKTIPSDVLVIHLRKFCNEAMPKDSLSRRDKLSPIKAELYHKNTLKNLRLALYRHQNRSTTCYQTQIGHQFRGFEKKSSNVRAAPFPLLVLLKFVVQSLCLSYISLNGIWSLTPYIFQFTEDNKNMFFFDMNCSRRIF